MTLPNNRKIFDMGRNTSADRPVRFVYQGNLPRDTAEQRLLDEYLAAVSAQVNAELDRQRTNLLAFSTTHPEMAARWRELARRFVHAPVEENAERVVDALMNCGGQHSPVAQGNPAPEIDYTQELADVPTIDEMWAKMEKLGILRDV